MPSPLTFIYAGIIKILAGTSESSNFTTLGILPPMPNEEVILTPIGQNVHVYLNYDEVTPGNSTIQSSSTVATDLEVHIRIGK